MIKPYQQAFIEFALQAGVLKFGEFTLKSGRKSPYFFNAGLFNSGMRLAKLGQSYAAAIEDAGIEFDVLFGPAYKGIPIASAASIALAQDFERDLPWCFNRKEAKDHGEGGNLVGAPLQGRVLIIDDVITAGTAIREVMTLIATHDDARPAGVVVALDRQEKGKADRSAIQEVEAEFGIPVISIINLNQLIEYMETNTTALPEFDAHLARVKAYRAQFGIE